jgi:hypothetical protein
MACNQALIRVKLVLKPICLLLWYKPWSARRTPEKTSVLCHVQVIVDKTLGSFRASHSGLMTKADQEECSFEPSVFFGAWDSVPIKEMGLSPTKFHGSPSHAYI